LSALPLISEFSERGISARVDGSRLILSPKEALTDELSAKVRKGKSALIVALRDIQKNADDDWAEVSADPAQLKAFTELLMIEKMRHQGIVPPHYTATTECATCGPVSIFAGVPDRVQGCPWCFNRIKGLPALGTRRKQK